MGLPLGPILKALAPLAADAAAAVLALRNSQKTAESKRVEDRVRVLEEEMLRGGQVTADLAKQLQLLAEQLRGAAAQLEARQRAAQATLGIAIAALVVAAASLVVALRA